MTTTDDSGVDAHVRRLWRHRGSMPPTARRGPRPQLDLDQILAAAIAIADTDGLAAVSTRAVAARFGKTAMALYPYVGGKEELLALMQDHASAMPAWSDPTTSLTAALETWALGFFELHLAHPWLTERPWSQASQGPNEQDWLERLAAILAHWRVTPPDRTVTVTMLYATVRACAETATAYRRMDQRGMVQWQRLTAATREQIPDLSRRYPHSTSLEPLTADWQDAPRTGLVAAVRLLASAVGRPRRRDR